jgi:exopolyphosphatase/guanosine-5'-triphosphate,3'-diphosphate pyrophosphatase
VRCACIDIGSNTTRLLVADCEEGVLTPVLQRRAFTRLGRLARPGAPLPDEAVAVLATVVRDQAATARAAGAQALRAVATAALRRVDDGVDVCAAVGAAAGAVVDLVGPEEEARLAFAGATASLADVAADVPITVVDVGGGSSELIVGTRAGGVTWSRSLPLGSGDLADAWLHSDPPSDAQLDGVRDAVAAALADVAMPTTGRAVAVGGDATSLCRLVGRRLDAASLAQAVAKLVRAPAAEVAATHGLDARRVRLLPTGILILAAVAARTGPLTVADGGLREGVVLELAARAR